MTESCAACGCEITVDRPDAGAMQHGEKCYCEECAAMILPPEELERMAKPAPAPARSKSSVLSSDDEVLGDEKGWNDETAPVRLPSREQAAPPKAPVSSRRETVTVTGKRKPSTRAAFVPPPPTRAVPVPPPAGRAPSSRRGGTASTNRAPASGRAEKEVPARDNSRLRKRNADSMGLYIGLGVGAVMLLLIGLFVFGRDKPEKAVKAKPKEVVLEDNDKTPSSEYERRAEEFQAKKDWQNASKMYNKAVDRAIKEGNSDKAKNLNLKNDSMLKSSTLK